MSADYDKRKQIKLTPENYDALVKAQAAFPLSVSISTRYRAIELGAPELLAPTKPVTKKGK
jgi:hypothetical protein